MPTTKLKLMPFKFAQDGSLSGTGTVGSNFVKQSYALPGRPQLGSGPMGTPDGKTCQLRKLLPVQQPKEPMQPTMPDMNLQTPTPPPAAVVAEEPVPERGFLVQAGAISSQANAQIC